MPCVSCILHSGQSSNEKARTGPAAWPGAAAACHEDSTHEDVQQKRLPGKYVLPLLLRLLAYTGTQQEYCGAGYLQSQTAVRCQAATTQHTQQL